MRFLRWGCRPVRHDLWDFAADRMPEGRMERVERHLHGCAACRGEVESFRRAQRLLSGARRAAPPSRSGWADLRERLANEPLAGSPGSGWAADARPAPPLAARLRGQLSLVGGAAALLLFAVFTVRAFAPPTVVFMTPTPAPQAETGDAPPDLRAAPLFPGPTLVTFGASGTGGGADVTPAPPASEPPARRIPPRPVVAQAEKRTPPTPSARPARKQDDARRLADARKRPETAPKGLRFTEHSPAPEEQAVEPDDADARRRYVMSTLIPVSNTEDKTY